MIADTHGLLRREAWQFLLGSQHIVHAGDIGDRSILEELRSIAPLSVVRGNNDTQPWAAQLPESERLTIGGVHIEVLHDRKARANLARASEEVHVVVTGHSHAPRLEWQAGVLYVNPGSAGPRRFKLPIAIGELVIAVGGTAKIAPGADLASGDRASPDLTSATRSFAARIVDLETGQPLASIG